METVLFVLLARTVLDVITDQGRGDTLAALTAERPWLLHSQVEVQSSVVSLPSISAGTVLERPSVGSHRKVPRPSLDSHQALVEAEIVKFPPLLLTGIDQGAAPVPSQGVFLQSLS